MWNGNWWEREGQERGKSIDRERAGQILTSPGKCCKGRNRGRGKRSVEREQVIDGRVKGRRMESVWTEEERDRFSPGQRRV